MGASKTAAVQFQTKPISTQDLESGTAEPFYQTALVFAKPHLQLVMKVVLILHYSQLAQGPLAD